MPSTAALAHQLLEAAARHQHVRQAGVERAEVAVAQHQTVLRVEQHDGGVDRVQRLQVDGSRLPPSAVFRARHQRTWRGGR